jgi:hypothetical protein
MDIGTFQDIDGNLIPPGTSPDIGAFELNF